MARSVLDDLGEEITGIVAPVSICMALVVVLVKALNPQGITDSTSVAIATLAYHEQDSDSTGEKLGGALLNAVIFMAAIAAMTFVLFLLFKWGCYRVIYGYMAFAMMNVFFFLTGALAIQLLRLAGLHMDLVSLTFLLFNFSVLGILALFFLPVPLLLKQGYTVWVGICVAYIFTHTPEWTTWVLLVIMALYDLAAVLLPGGPLKILVELAVERQQELPALVYESRPVGRPYQRGMWSRRQQQQQQQQRQAGADTPPHSGGGGGLGLRGAALAAAVLPPLLAGGGGGGGGSSSGGGAGGGGGDASPSHRVALLAGHRGSCEDLLMHEMSRSPLSSPLKQAPAAAAAAAVAAATAAPALPGAAAADDDVAGRISTAAEEGQAGSRTGLRGGGGGGGGGARGSGSSSCSSRGPSQAGGQPLGEGREGARPLSPQHQQQQGLCQAGGSSGAQQQEQQQHHGQRAVQLPCDGANAAATAGCSSSVQALAAGPRGPVAEGREALTAGPAGAGAGAGSSNTPGGAEVLPGASLPPPLEPPQPAALLTGGPGTSLPAAGAAGCVDPLGPGPGGSEQQAQQQRQEGPEGGGQRLEYGQEGEEGEDASSQGLPDAIKLGLGDFIFYSMLVGRAAMYDMMTVFASYLAIIAGLVITLLLLALARKALPALPVSIALGVLFYFLTRLVLEPVVVPLSLSLGYY